eukprot:5333813-Amphidinium_carterae.1
MIFDVGLLPVKKKVAAVRGARLAHSSGPPSAAGGENERLTAKPHLCQLLALGVANHNHMFQCTFCDRTSFRLWDRFRLHLWHGVGSWSFSIQYTGWSFDSVCRMRKSESGECAKASRAGAIPRVGYGVHAVLPKV